MRIGAASIREPPGGDRTRDTLGARPPVARNGGDSYPVRMHPGSIVRLLGLLAAAIVLSTTGCKRSDASPEPGGAHRVVADEHGFTPASLALPQGGPGSKASVTFVRTSDETCATEVVFPELGIKKELPLKKPVDIDVPTDQGRTLAFQCGMAMFKGALVIK